MFNVNAHFNHKNEYKIFEISLSSNKITSKGTIALMEAIRNKKRIQAVILDNNTLDDECIPSIGELIQICEGHTYIHLSNIKDAPSSITDKGIRELAPYLQKSKSALYIELKRHPGITNNIVYMLAETILNTNIQSISLSETSITDPFNLFISSSISANHGRLVANSW